MVLSKLATWSSKNKKGPHQQAFPRLCVTDSKFMCRVSSFMSQFTVFLGVILQRQGRLYVEVCDLECVRLNEVAAGFDDVAHEGREDFLGLVGVGDFDLQQ